MAKSPKISGTENRACPECGGVHYMYSPPNEAYRVWRCDECHAFNTSHRYIKKMFTQHGREWLERRIRSSTRILKYMKELLEVQ